MSKKSKVTNLDLIRKNLETFTLKKIHEYSERLSLQRRREKTKAIEDILVAMKEYEDYKTEKVDKYTRYEQLGSKGKEGTTYLVKDKEGKVYAMKTFRPAKSSQRLKEEYKLQKKASKVGVAPKVYDYDVVGKWIVMEKMDKHLLEVMKKKPLKKEQQERIVEICKHLDKIGVFHNDNNPANFMCKDDKIYLIDYGFAKEITPKLCKKLNTTEPNYKLMTVALILKFKEIGIDEKSYKYLLQHVSNADKVRYGFLKKKN